jgi:hypothetical protein
MQAIAIPREEATEKSAASTARGENAARGAVRLQGGDWVAFLFKLFRELLFGGSSAAHQKNRGEKP